MKTIERPTSFPAVVDLIVPKKHPKIYIKIQKLKDIKMGFFFYNWFNGLRQRLILDIAKNL